MQDIATVSWSASVKLSSRLVVSVGICRFEFFETTVSFLIFSERLKNMRVFAEMTGGGCGRPH